MDSQKKERVFIDPPLPGEKRAVLAIPSPASLTKFLQEHPDMIPAFVNDYITGRRKTIRYTWAFSFLTIGVLISLLYKIVPDTPISDVTSGLLVAGVIMMIFGMVESYIRG